MPLFEPELEFIADLGCQLAQGYLIGKPLPEDQAQALLANGPVLADPAS